MLKENAFYKTQTGWRPIVFVVAIAVVQAVYLPSASAEPGPRSPLFRGKSSPGTIAGAPATEAKLPRLREEMNPLKQARKLAASNQAFAEASLVGQAKSPIRGLTFREKLEGRRARSGQSATAALTVRSKTTPGHVPLSFAEKLKARPARSLQRPQNVSNVEQRRCLPSRVFENRALQKAGGSMSLGCAK